MYFSTTSIRDLVVDEKTFLEKKLFFSLINCFSVLIQEDIKVVRCQ